MASVLPPETPDERIIVLEDDLAYWKDRHKNCAESLEKYTSRYFEQMRLANKFKVALIIVAVWSFIFIAVLAVLLFGQIAVTAMFTGAMVIFSVGITYAVYKESTR